MIKRPILTASLLVGIAIASGACIAAPSDCKLLTIAEWPVRVAHSKVVVDGTINGQKIGIVLDTGAERSLILRSAAVRLGLALRRVRSLRLFGIGGETEVESAHVDEFKIGDSTRKNWQVIVAGEQDLGDNVAFLLGDDFFHRVDVEFDLVHGVVRLFQTKDCADESLAYWSPDGADQVPIDAVDDDHPRVALPVRVNGQPLRALLDSGANVSVMTTDGAARLGVTPETPGVVAAGSSIGLGARKIDSWIGPFHSFSIGRETIENPRIRFSNLWKDVAYRRRGSDIPLQLAYEPMVLGADFLVAHRVLVAHSQRKLYFTYAGGMLFQTSGPAQAGRDPGQDVSTKPKGDK